jgi:hypothetical protein
MTDEPFTLSSESPPAKRQWVIPEPVELLIEHPLPIANGYSRKSWSPAGSCYARLMARRCRCTRVSSELSNEFVAQRRPPRLDNYC